MKFSKIYILTLLLSFFVSGNVNAADGPATVYKIKIHKIEFCEDGSTQASCSNATIVYDGGTAGSGYINIADTTAGAAAASLGNLNKLNLDVKYTWMQVTLSRAMKVSGYATDGSGTKCYTEGGESGTASLASDGNPTASNQAETTLYAAIGSTGNTTAMESLTAVSGGTVRDAGTITNGDEFFRIRNEISGGIIIKGGKIPTAKIAFGFSSAVGAIGDMEDACNTNGAAVGLYAAEPDVSISFE